MPPACASGRDSPWPKIRCAPRPRPKDFPFRNSDRCFERNTRRLSRRSRPAAPRRRIPMRHSKDNNTSALGLDVGTSRVCLAQRVGEEFQYETQLNAFVTIPYSKMTENVLRKEKVPHTVNGAEMVVHGNESDRFADLLNIETRRTMDRGVLNPAEPDSLSMLRKIIETLVDPTKEKQKLCF